MGFIKGFAELMMLTEIDEKSDSEDGETEREHKNVTERINAKESEINVSQSNIENKDVAKQDVYDKLEIIQRIMLLIIGIIMGFIFSWMLK